MTLKGPYLKPASMKLTAQNLTGRFVQLEPLAEAHREGLRSAMADPALWAYWPVNGSGAGFDGWFDGVNKSHAAGAEIVFAVRRLAGQAIAGTTRFMAIVPIHKRVEIGGTMYSKAAQASAVNPECKLLLLNHAFGAGANRVELKTDARNVRSRAAILKLGAAEEGVFRAHMIMPDGFPRDTAYFSILRTEWPDVRAKLEARLAAYI